VFYWFTEKIMTRVFTFNRKFKITLSIALLFCALIPLIWWQFISLKPYTLSQSELQKVYQQHADFVPTLTLTELTPRQYKITFTSYDGEYVEGRLELPKKIVLEDWRVKTMNEVTPIFIGVSAMGRNYLRWWQDSFKGRDTVTQVNDIGAMALASNHVLVSIDARLHGTRKKPDMPLSKVMNSMDFWGERSHYEGMVINTVLDYKHLLNALEELFGLSDVTLAGYSMGGQVSLLLAATDPRVRSVLSIVPPNMDNKVARVAPINFVENIKDQKVWLLSANNDGYAGERQNQLLFKGIQSSNKHHITFNSGHILPEGYTEQLSDWFEQK
jgi:hypothetical protein